MLGDRFVNYWDTCIFLAWLKNEQRKDPLETQGVAEQIRMFESGEIFVITSMVTIAEVLESSLDEISRETFSTLRRMPDKIEFVQPNFEIMDISHEIRDYYFRENQVNNGLTITTPDAIHLATAISEKKCDVFYTFDCRNKDNRGEGCKNQNKKGCLALTPLSSNIAGKYKLSILKPPPPDQLHLLDEGEKNA